MYYLKRRGSAVLVLCLMLGVSIAMIGCANTRGAGSGTGSTAVGDSCRRNGDCRSGYCGYDNGTRVCTNGGLGSGCFSDAQCANNLCGAGACTDGAIGSNCGGDIDCQSGYCDDFNNVCTDGGIGAGCQTGSNCASSRCVSRSCR